MARVNVGVNPLYLADQHIVAESVEITMIVGSLRVNGYQIKGFKPEQYGLGKGHINFFKDKLIYLALRLYEVNQEMKRRGFRPGTNPDLLLKEPEQFLNDWAPELEDSMIVRRRIIEKMIKKPEGFWRYSRAKIGDIDSFVNDILISPVYFV